MPVTIDYQKATKLLAKGASVRQVAYECGCTTQAIYYAISVGHVKRPAPR